MPERSGYKADIVTKRYRADIESKRYRADIDTNRSDIRILASEAGALFLSEDGKLLVES